MNIERVVSDNIQFVYESEYLYLLSFDLFQCTLSVSSSQFSKLSMIPYVTKSMQLPRQLRIYLIESVTSKFDETETVSRGRKFLSKLSFVYLFIIKLGLFIFRFQIYKSLNHLAYVSFQMKFYKTKDRNRENYLEYFLHPVLVCIR